MSDFTIDLAPFRPHLDHEPGSALLRRCLAFETPLPVRKTPAPALPWDSPSLRIERLKQSRPREAAEQATTWLEETLRGAERAPRDETAVGLLCSALSTWSGLQRTLGQRGDAALAAHHALRLLQPQPLQTRAGFALQRAAFILGDLDAIEAGLSCLQQARTVHQATPGGRQNVGLTLTGLGAFQLFYRRHFAAARAAFTLGLHALGSGDDDLLVGASHGVAYSYLMEGRLDDARESLHALRQLVPAPAADQDVRLFWLEAEIAAASGNHARALECYDDVCGRMQDVTEASGPVLVSFDAARILLEHATASATWRRWQQRLCSLLPQLTRPEQAVLEPYLDALAAGDLDRELLDSTTVAFKRASNAMLLGMGRPGNAGRPELRGQHAA